MDASPLSQWGNSRIFIVHFPFPHAWINNVQDVIEQLHLMVKNTPQKHREVCKTSPCVRVRALHEA